MVGRRVLNPKTRNLPRLQLVDRLQPLRSLIPMESLPAQILVLKEETLPQTGLPKVVMLRLAMQQVELELELEELEEPAALQTLQEEPLMGS